jgi:hypothetical protein
MRRTGPRIGIIGSRTWQYAFAINDFVQKLKDKYPGAIIVSGGAKEGADAHAEAAARKFGIPFMSWNADWNGPLGKAAGFDRNGEIAEDVERLMAYWDGKSPCTLDTVEKALALGREVYIVQCTEPKSPEDNLVFRTRHIRSIEEV